MSILAAQISEWGTAPKTVRISSPAAPVDDSQVQIRVIATGLHQVARSRAEGKHYTSVSLPHTPGIDGTGIDVATGKLVYFTALKGEGSFVEVVNVPKASVYELPQGVDPVQAAALMNPVMSSWMALRKRVDSFKEGQPAKPWSCFILGATSMSGRVAIRVARLLGATRIIGAARNEAALKTLGLDDTIVLQNDAEATDFSSAADADVVLDYLYGPYFTNFFTSRSTLKADNPITWVCIGAVAGNFGTVASAALRKRDVTIRGSGFGAWSFADFEAEAPEMLKVLVGVKEEGIREVKLEDVESEWNNTDGGRVVFVLGEGQGQ
ncbi:hypothetical protein B0T10DRAFT_548156 [Thelonectria olida]|uniref:Uncharacterized protein n=1 Tax=Thelonectria olida TaxID=1576542 RepID=A0A9P9AMS7_9HYPO|nr:hypothetical protein B0T10DRAFT_548156 [Thelonectria olida]